MDLKPIQRHVFLQRSFTIFLVLILIVLTGSLQAQPEPPESVEEVGHLGGRLDGSMTQGDITYLAIGASLVIVQNQNGQLVRTGTLPLPDRIHQFHVSGNTLVLSYDGDALKSTYDIIDVSDPTLPTQVSQSQISGTARSINKIVIDGNYVYLMPGDAATDLKAVHVVDISEPVAPNEISVYDNALIIDFVPTGNAAFLIQGTPADPTNNQILFMDITNKTSFNVGTTMDFPDARYMRISGNLIYIAKYYNGGLDIVDIADDQNPVLIGQYGTRSYTEMAVTNGTAILRNARRLVVLDVTDPAEPRLAGESESTSNFFLDGASGNSAFIRQDGVFKILDLTDPDNPTTLSTYREPDEVRGQVILSEHLYLATGDDIVVYSLDHPEAPEFVQSIDFPSVNKVFGSGSILIATDWRGPSNARLYDISDPSLPQPLNAFTINTQVLEVGFVGNNIIVLKRPLNGPSSLKIMDMSDPANLLDISEYLLPGTATDMSISTDGSIATVSYINGATGHGFEIIDISNPGTPARLFQTDRTEIPQTVLFQNSLLYVGLNLDEDNGPAQFDVYDISDPLNPMLETAFQTTPTSPVFQLIESEGFLFASFPDQGVGNYTYNVETHQFTVGPFTPYKDAQLITPYYPISTSNNLNKQLDDTERYLFVDGGSEVNGEIQGQKGIRIIKMISGGGAQAYSLTVQIAPADAADKGATVDVSPEKVSYSEGESVTLSAKDGDEGWTFKEYTGDVISSNREADLSMTGAKKAKTVTAHYVQPTLSISGHFDPRKVICPCDASEEDAKIWQLTLTADEEDGWFINKVFLKNLKDSYGIKNAILTGPTKSAQAVFNGDSTSMTFTFSTPEVVPINSSITLTLDFQFDIESKPPECDLDRVYEYMTELSKLADVTATPILYDSGLLMGSTPTLSNSTFIGRVQNFAGYGFVSITHALQDETTQPGDQILVCPGVYTENIDVTFPVTIKSLSGKDLTVIQEDPNNISNSSIFRIRAKGVTIDGFTLRMEKFNGLTPAVLVTSETNNFTIKNCTFDKGNIVWYTVSGTNRMENIYLKGIETKCIRLRFSNGVQINRCVLDGGANIGVHFYKSSNCVVEGCEIRTSQSGIGMMVGSNSEDNRIIDNRCETVDIGVLITEGSKRNHIEKNTFVKINRPIEITDASENTVQANLFEEIEEGKPYILLLNGAKDNVISNHELGVDPKSCFLSKSQEANRIVDNRVYRINLQNTALQEVEENTVSTIQITPGSQNNWITNNTVQASLLEDGISLNQAQKNHIVENTVRWCKKNGIFLYNKSNDNVISDNEIFSNDESGIRIDAGQRNRITENRIFYNNEDGISLGSGFSQAHKTKITYNYIYNNNGDGIFFNASDNLIISHNEIFRNSKSGINAFCGNYAFLSQNYIHDHKTNEDLSAGIDLQAVMKGTTVINNRLDNNATGIMGKSVAQLLHHTNVIKNNIVTDSNFLNTGIHLDGFSPQISGNWIENNNGAGIFTENGAQPVIHNNCILDNNPFAINNIDGTVIIDAQQNWFGNAAGPDAGDISGQVNTDNWLLEPLSLLLTVIQDTVFLPLGQVDSVEIIFQNYADFDDVLDLSVTSQRGWIQNETELTIQLEDSLGSSHFIVLEADAGSATGTMDTIVVEVFSQSDPQSTARDSFIVSLYTSMLAGIRITPDSLILVSGDSVHFSASGWDQHSSFVPFVPVWSATGGTITENGMFTAGVDTGWFVITAQNGDGSVQATADIYISGLTSVEDKKTMARPTEFRLDQNFPNPFNPETTIKFDVKETCRVVLKIYDVLGREVYTLVDEVRPYGSYQVSFNANFLPTGLYFYRISMKNFHAVKKMLLLE